MFGLAYYFIILTCSCLALMLLQRDTVVMLGKPNLRCFSKRHFLLFVFAVSPIVLTYMLRYGIGTDYFSYKRIFETLHGASIPEYIAKHKVNNEVYYVEPGYFVLNRFCCISYVSLNLVCSVLMFFFIYYGTVRCLPKADITLSVLIYFCTQFIYSMNGMRFAIAVTIVFFGFRFILAKQLLKWILTIVVAVSFHKTSLMCIPLYFLCNIENKKLSKIRNTAWYLFVFAFPIIAKFFIQIVSQMSIFSRYFAVAQYALGVFTFKPMFLFHIVPVILPLLILKKQFLFNDYKASVLFRLYLFEVPLRELGSFNTWLTRLTRFPQIVQVIFVPYVLSSIKNSKMRKLLTVYYVMLYAFFFIYGAVVNDAGDSLPYRSILFI